MFIEVGKAYKTRDGHIVHVDSRNDSHLCQHPMLGTIRGHDGEDRVATWSERGEFLRNERHEYDLISEIQEAVNMKVSMEGEYYTRSEYPVRIYATGCGGDYPVHGAYYYAGAWYSCVWTIDGRAREDAIMKPLLDLRMVDKRVYVNVYEFPDGSYGASVFEKPEDAVGATCPAVRLAKCVHVTLSDIKK